ncbi:MAG: right-handed parallel beta-helix repeat-containing protein [Candidatus Hydrogenedentes bacterium]|nr:right-handed parallel beta-helix repeat-containing protein [Candidatus Hydrogenedentota bacterium]
MKIKSSLPRNKIPLLTVFIIVSLLLHTFLFTEEIREPIIIYVSTLGNDEWSGNYPEPLSDNKDGPVATLERARDLLREKRGNNLGKGGVVLIRAGNYFLKNTLYFEDVDSGSEEFPIVWQAYKGEEVNIIGGIQIEKLEPWKENISKAYVGKLESTPRILLLSKEIQTLARWPNSSENQLPGGEWSFITGIEMGKNKSSFICEFIPSSLNSTNIINLEVGIFSNYNWAFQIVKVKNILNESKTIELEQDLNYEAQVGRRFYLQNHPTLIDEESEWYYDHETGELLFYYPYHKYDTTQKPILSTINTIVHLKNAKYINFIGLNFIASNDSGIVVENSENCLIAKASIYGIYKTGISIINGKNNRVLGCDLFELGGTGISVQGGDRKTLTPANHQIVNNHIHTYAKIHRTYHPGISVSGVGIRIAHNEIHDAPHSAIILSGNDHIIEYNRIYRVCEETADAGAFYMGRDWTYRGNILRNNVFHDIYGFGLTEVNNADGSLTINYESPLWGWGIYLDDCSSGVTVEGNIIYRVPLCGVMIGGGRDNIVDNNIFVECIPALHIDARWDGYCWDVMDERLEAMNPKEPPYSVKYPEILSLYQSDRRKPANNKFTRNIIYYQRDDFCGISNMASEKAKSIIYDLSLFDAETCKFDRNLIFHFGKEIRVNYHPYGSDKGDKISFSKWQELGFDNSSIVGNPTFLSIEHDDYWLLFNSLAIRTLQFKQIPLHRIGCYFDEFRKTWPIEKPKPNLLKNRKTWKIVKDYEGFKVEVKEYPPLEEAEESIDIEKIVAPLLTPKSTEQDILPLENMPIQQISPPETSQSQPSVGSFIPQELQQTPRGN